MLSKLGLGAEEATNTDPLRIFASEIVKNTPGYQRLIPSLEPAPERERNLSNISSVKKERIRDRVVNHFS